MKPGPANALALIARLISAVLFSLLLVSSWYYSVVLASAFEVCSRSQHLQNASRARWCRNTEPSAEAAPCARRSGHSGGVW